MTPSWEEKEVKKKKNFIMTAGVCEHDPIEENTGDFTWSSLVHFEK